MMNRSRVRRPPEAWMRRACAIALGMELEPPEMLPVEEPAPAARHRGDHSPDDVRWPHPTEVDHRLAGGAR